jgi:hypothetical protein
MSEWVKKAAELERHRRQRVKEFSAAAKDFLHEFARQIDDDKRTFEQEFGERVKTGFFGPLRFQVELQTPEAVNPTRGSLIASPERGVLMIVHEGDRPDSMEIPAQVVEGRLMIEASQPGAHEIRQLLLLPILFPKLNADASALSDLQG